MKFEELSSEDKIFLLQQELQQAVWTTYFLHNCLTQPDRAQYAYPEQTLNHIASWEKILPEAHLCAHSINQQDCLSCKINKEIRHRRKEIEDKLNEI